MDMTLSKLQKLVTDREGKPGMPTVLGVTKSQTRLSNWTELNWTHRKLPVIKVVESSDFTNEKRQFLSLSIRETHLLWAPLGGPQRFAIILCIEANFLLFAPYPLITIVLEWINFFFSHYELFIPSFFIPLHLVSQTLPETMLIPTAPAIPICLRVV